MRTLTVSSTFLSSIQQNLPNTFLHRYKTAPISQFQFLNPSTLGLTNKASSFRWKSTGAGGGTKILASAGAVPTSVPVQVAHELLQAGHHYLDVRTPEEYSAGHPVGSVNVPYMFKVGSGMSKNPEFLDQVSARFGKDDEIIVGCQAGKRSLMAATDLISAGYTGITDIAGGYAAWVQNGLPTDLQ